MLRRAFTIVELLMVLAIIATLMGLVTGASVGAIRSARERRTEAMRTALQSAIVSYQAADPQGEWPGGLNDLADASKSGLLKGEEAQRVFRLVVQKSTGQGGGGVPLVDPSALFVAPSGAQGGKSRGMDFQSARTGGPHQAKLALARMEFGYPGRKTGKFHHFNLYYNAQTDTIKVLTCCEDCATSSGGCMNVNCPRCHKSEK